MTAAPTTDPTLVIDGVGMRFPTGTVALWLSSCTPSAYTSSRAYRTSHPISIACTVCGT